MISSLKRVRNGFGLFSPEQSASLLSAVSIPYMTQYSIVYDLTTGEVWIVTERNYQQVYRYQLQIK